jgi:hypothetical protein
MFARRPSSETREALLARQAAEPRTSVHEAHRQPLGLSPAAFLGTLSLATFLLVLVLLITGVWIGAIIALGILTALMSLLIPAVRHDPESRAARTARRGLIQTTGTARFAAVATRTWTDAGISLLHLKRERLHLRRQLDSRLAPLGEAVHRGDQARAQELNAQADRLEHELTEIDRLVAAIIDDARRTVEREKANAQLTEALPATDGTPRSRRLTRRERRP